jgi:hypothetical protein
VRCNLPGLLACAMLLEGPIIPPILCCFGAIAYVFCFFRPLPLAAQLPSGAALAPGSSVRYLVSPKASALYPRRLMHVGRIVRDSHGLLSVLAARHSLTHLRSFGCGYSSNTNDNVDVPNSASRPLTKTSALRGIEGQSKLPLLGSQILTVGCRKRAHN